MPIRKPPKRKLQRDHSPSTYMSVQSLTKAGSSLRLDIYAHDERLGRLEIGRGVVWWGRRHRKKMVRMSWIRFAQKMNELAYG